MRGSNARATYFAPREMLVWWWAIVASLLLPALVQAQVPDEEFTTEFRLQDARLETRGKTTYFPLKPGRRLILEGEDDEGTVTTLAITVLHQIKTIVVPIGGRLRLIRTRVVEEREFEDCELVEVSRNYFVVDDRTRNVYYFGEDVDIFDEDGNLESHDGAWLAGRDGAKPGLIMPGSFLLGSRYFQEVAEGVAMDQGTHTRMGLTVATEFGTLTDCVEVIETTPLEPGHESRKVYAPGIGLIVDGDVELVAVIDRVNDNDVFLCQEDIEEENGEP